jgi:hypothetical protein
MVLTAIKSADSISHTRTRITASSRTFAYGRHIIHRFTYSVI